MFFVSHLDLNFVVPRAPRLPLALRSASSFFLRFSRTCAGVNAAGELAGADGAGAGAVVDTDAGAGVGAGAAAGAAAAAGAGAATGEGPGAAPVPLALSMFKTLLDMV